MLSRDDRPVVIEISDQGLYQIAKKISEDENFTTIKPSSIEEFIDLANNFYINKKRVASVADRIQIADLLAVIYLSKQSPPRDSNRIFFSDSTDKKVVERITKRLEEARKIIKTYS